MAGISNDYIQQQLLDQSVSMNDNLSAMREILLDVKRNTGNGRGNGGGSGGAGGNGNGGNGNRGGNRGGGNNGGGSAGAGGFRNAFRDLFGEAGNIGRNALGNNGNVQNIVGGLGASARVLQRSLGALPGPIGAVASGFMQIVQVGAMVYDYLNQQLQMYNQLNSAGLTLANGMLTVRKGSGSAFMSINEFSQAVTKNSDALAAMEGMYGDGVEHFGELLNTVQLAQEQMGLYGVSQQQLADLAAKNFKFEKMYASQRTLRNMNESQSTTKFVGSMTYLSKAVGKSVDELLSRFNDLSNNIDTGATINALQTQAGFTEQKSVEVMKTWNSMFASMGEFGKTAQQLNASKWSLGSLPEEFNDEVSQQFAEFMKSLQQSGITDQRTINRMTAQFIKEHQGMISKQADIDRAVGNTAAENFHRQMLLTMNLLNDPKNNPSPIIEDFTNRFNLWLGATFTEPFNKFYSETAERAASYLTDLANRSTDGWDFMSKLATDAVAQFGGAMAGPLGMLSSIPSKLMGMIFGESWNKVVDAFGNLSGDLIQIPIRMGKLIWEMFTGSDADIDTAGKEIAGTIKRIFADVTEVFTKISKMSINFDDVKAKFQDAFNSLKNRLTGMWDRVKSWWKDSDDDTKTDDKTASNNTKPTPTATQQKTAGVQKVTAPPEYTPPTKVEQADQTESSNVETIKNSDNEQVSKLLSQILNNLESQGQNSGQLAIILRQIAENTEPPRNV